MKQALETFRFDYEYEFDYEYDLLAFVELVMLTSRSSATLVINRRKARRFDPTVLRTAPVENLVVTKSRNGRSRTPTRCDI